VDAAVSLGEEVRDVVGHPGPGTSSEELVIEGTSALSASGIREGKLLQAQLRDTKALYQVTSAQIIARQESGLARERFSSLRDGRLAGASLDVSTGSPFLQTTRCGYDE
jgi:hypothetical protein